MEAGRDPDSPASSDRLAEQVSALRRYIRVRMGRSLRAREWSEDIVGSICREALAVPQHQLPSDAEGLRRWLFHAAELKLRDRARYWNAAKRAAGSAETAEPDQTAAQEIGPPDEAVAREAEERIARALAMLEPDDRALILAHRLRGVSYLQLAAELGTSPHYVRTMLSRALARLARQLDIS